jgi:hypothetical protein
MKQLLINSIHWLKYNLLPILYSVRVLYCSGPKKQSVKRMQQTAGSRQQPRCFIPVEGYVSRSCRRCAAPRTPPPPATLPPFLLQFNVYLPPFLLQFNVYLPPFLLQFNVYFSCLTPHHRGSHCVAPRAALSAHVRTNKHINQPPNLNRAMGSVTPACASSNAPQTACTCLSVTKIQRGKGEKTYGLYAPAPNSLFVACVHRVRSDNVRDGKRLLTCRHSTTSSLGEAVK